ncbi:MAG: hypothetical protein MUO76_04140 [Anaerolineaceae bacterium]|nr:hypothetical protein [Anaerolineaceae bacterium]
MKLTDKQTRIFLFAAQGIGAVFYGVFLAAYFGGLPSTATLNSEPAFVFSQSVIGALLIAFVLVAIILAFIFKQKN